ncbi:uncharacterized protein LOC129962484 [Argiope bruennichi]|uniref:uncharacterized protein LOC129962484 n=1 Tax=Argiope bruennichi TaxID=94029 RepID=UPI0024948DEE|nr:uncharacterized protein LOC129962484 [Argiope bruennichi]
MPSPRRSPPSHLPKAGLVLMVAHMLAVSGVPARTTCAGGEWRCGGDDGGGKCISLNKFCDGIENCEDGSDEPLGCTNCNRTFYGEANVKYPLRVTGPFQRYLPFVCKITFVAAGKEFGDFVELTFLSFQIGRLELTRNQTSICQKGYLKISEWSDSSRDWDDDASITFYSPGRYSSVFPRVPEESITRLSPNFGEFCGSMIERSVTFFSQGSNVSVMAVVPSRASIPSTSFSLYLTYRFLKRRPTQESGKSSYMGRPVPGTYCDREFLDCHSNRRCRIRTPNFPGFYPRNITCHYFIRHPKAPEGYTAKIVLSQPNDYKISVPTGRATSTSGTSFLLSTDCISGDAVRIYDGPSTRSPQILEFCGSGSLPEIVSSGNELLVQIYSAPYQHLSNSRVEIEVSVRYEMVQIETPEDNGRCLYTLDGTKRRWGLLHSPKHTMPPNTNCTYRLIGASKHDRIWLYFVSFFALVEKQPTSPNTENSCSVSKLEIYDLGEAKSNVSGSSSGISEPSHLFCGETGPRLCAHAADYPPKYLPPRPCEVPNESYFSQGSEMIIRHRFLSFASELLTTSTSSFTARYEFIDTNQQGTQIDHSECDRRLDSRLGKQGTIANSRNVFLYGRGGRHNLTCMFHFVGLPTERLKLTIKKARLKNNKSLCSSYYDPVFQRHGCRMSAVRQGFPQSLSWSLLGASEHWSGYSSPVGCTCDAAIEKDSQAMVFESVVSNVKLNFEIVGMSHLEDFEDYFFEADYEFLNYSLCDIGLRRHSGLSGDGILSFQLPSSHSKVPSPSRPIRCRWKIEASPHKHLYLKFKGFNASIVEECPLGSRLLVYLDPHEKPVANACVDSDKSDQKADELVEFDIFSHTWYNESRNKIHGQERDRLFVEMVSSHDSASFVIQWLEVTRPFVRTQSGQTLRNVDCLFECPEIGACIDPELWCDGTAHCPSGFDESPDHCKYFPVAYVSCAAAVGFVTILILIWFAVRRRRLRKMLKKKDIRQFPPDDYCVESPIG